MKRNPFVSVLLIVTMLLLLSAKSFAAISVRGTAVMPSGVAKDFGKTGIALEVVATLKLFPTNVLQTAVMVTTGEFGKKETDYVFEDASVKQSSKISLTGGGIGLRLEPPTLILKPFAEVFGRIASIEQEYRAGTGGTELESKTKFGYQANAGIKYSFLPKVGLEAGVSYQSFFNADLKSEQKSSEVDIKSYGVFAGVCISLGL